MKNIEEIFSSHILQTIKIKQTLLNDNNFKKDFIQITKVVTGVIKKSGKILACGNGGSNSDAQHMTAEFMVRLRKEFIRGPIPCINIGSESPTATAHTNDLNFKTLFSRSVLALSKKNDCLIVFSTSGNSDNIIEALKISKKLKIKTIGFLGNNGGLAKKLCDHSVIIPSKITPFIQEAHISLIHILVRSVEENI